jgi:hypothetical protein
MSAVAAAVESRTVRTVFQGGATTSGRHVPGV